MSSTYPGVPVYHAQTVLPSDGDPAIAESVNVALRDLMDDAAYAYAQLTLRVDFLSPGVRAYNQDPSAFVTISGSGQIILATNVQVGGGGGPAKQLNVVSDTTFLGSSNTTFRNALVALVSPNTVIGSGPSSALTVLSSTAFQAGVGFAGDVVLGNSPTDAVTVPATAHFNAPAYFNNNLTATNILGVSESLSGNLTVAGNTTLGNSSGDSHSANGSYQFNGDITVQGNAQVDGDLNVDGNLDIDGSCQLGDNDTSDVVEVHGIFRTFGRTTLGSSDDDSLFINATLKSPLAMSDAGRVPLRATIGPISGTVPLSPLSCNCVHFQNLQIAGVDLNIDDSAAVNDDFFEISIDNSISPGRQVKVYGPGGILTTLTSTGSSYVSCKVVRISGTWRVTQKVN